ncbi:MAG: hypothetical protein IPN67_15750 [Bacteroidales bacterium]|nr:hypothetical protein [Bacteroidales bacterium]MBK8883770.1 hypothetical protein [Bacteroidales bacterium]
MKTNSNHPYHSIESFEDFRFERERLLLKTRLIEAKINMEIVLIRQYFSVSNILVSLTRDIVLPKISEFLGSLSQKIRNDSNQ